MHRGSHPTIGVVDNICFSPLGPESMSNVISIAQEFSQQLHEQCDVPIYHYGQLGQRRLKLKDIRRSLGYFSPSNTSSTTNNNIVADIPSIIDPKKGVSCIGAVPLIVNLNIRFQSCHDVNQVKKVTKTIRRDDVSTILISDVFRNVYN
jgi:glutamate formiminotransferase